jgi:hypothetical protein
VQIIISATGREFYKQATYVFVDRDLASYLSERYVTIAVEEI